MFFLALNKYQKEPRCPACMFYVLAGAEQVRFTYFFQPNNLSPSNAGSEQVPRISTGSNTLSFQTHCMLFVCARFASSESRSQDQGLKFRMQRTKNKGSNLECKEQRTTKKACNKRTQKDSTCQERLQKRPDTLRSDADRHTQTIMQPLAP